MFHQKRMSSVIAGLSVCQTASCKYHFPQVSTAVYRNVENLLLDSQHFELKTTGKYGLQLANTNTQPPILSQKLNTMANTCTMLVQN